MLFITAFLAATVLPLTSEVAFVAAVKNGVPNALLVASLGNALGVAVNYAIGRIFHDRAKTKLLASKLGATSYDYAHRYGYVALLLSWLPLIGDPLTIAAGLFRLNFLYFAFMAMSLRVARYYFLLGLFS